MGRFALLAGVSAIGLGLAGPGTAAAQSRPAVDAGVQAVDEVVVTARRREELAYEVPASLDVFSGQALAASGVNTLVDLQYRTPGLKIATGGGGSRISLRGVGTNISSGSPSIATHLDGVYVPSSRFALGEVFDSARIEVLKGPQGTLYGRNATGGAINIVSQAPGRSFGADGWVGYGSDNLVTAQGGVSIPLADRGGLRLSGAYANDDGYTSNVHTAGGDIDNRDYAGGRLRLNYDLTDALTVDVTAQYSVDRGTVGFGGSNNPESQVYASLPPQREDPRRINVDTPPRSKQEGLLLSGVLTYDFGDVTLRSITGYVDFKTRSVIDVDGSGGLIAFSDTLFDSELFSQEFQLSGGESEGVNWTVGLYYSSEDSSTVASETDADYPDPTPYLFSNQVTEIENRSFAVYGELTWPLSERLSVVAGARYTKEEQSGTSVLDVPLFFPDPFVTEASVENDGFAPKLLVKYELGEAAQLYASVTRGFKNGGVNLSTSAETFDPENIWAYEAGAKAQLADGLGELSFAAFYYDYSDLQLRSVIFTDTGFVTEINNASKAVVQGLEASGVIRPTAWLSLDLSGAFMDSELEDFILPGTTTVAKGLPLPLTPEWSGALGIELSTEVGDASRLTARAEVTYQSSVNFPNFTDLERERQKGYALVNANIRYDLPGDRISLSLIGRNLTDELYLTQRFFYSGFADVEFYGAPRSVEARIGLKF